MPLPIFSRRPRRRRGDSPRGALAQALAQALRTGSIALAIGALPSPAAAAPAVTLHASLRPEKLGASTNVSVGFRISAGLGAQPAQLRSFALQLPPGMGFVSTTLGVATCSEQTLLAGGAAACPRESLMGSGEALVQAPFGPLGVDETAGASIFMTTPVDGHTTMLFYFDGRAPVIATLLLQTEILTPEGSSESVLSSEVPQIATAPGSANLAILELQVNIGPRDILYYKRVHGRTVAYHPTGLFIPERCPTGGFVFGGSFAFQDGSHVRSSAAISCPPHGGARGRGRAGRSA